MRECIRDVRAASTISEREWVVEADESFDCLKIVRLDPFAIERICYLTEEELERARRAARQCKTNANPPRDGRTLRPGCYYRLEITTSVAARLNLDALPFSRSGFLGSMMVDAYEEVLRLLGFDDDAEPTAFREVAFFQTENPPEHLGPYVKWSSPRHQSERVFCEDDLAIRLLRSNVAPMFRDPYRLEIAVRDVGGSDVPGYRTEWTKARSATLFAEEQVWMAHRSGLGSPAVPPAEDDVLIARRRTAAALAPRSRYELRVVRREDRGKPAEVPLFSTTFTTSAFASFAALVASYRGDAGRVTAKAGYQAALSTVPGLLAPAAALARAEANLIRAEVDYRFEALTGGRAAFEAVKIDHRRARATHDETFRGLAERLADLCYLPPVPWVEVFVVEDEMTRRPVCVWVRSPETIDVRIAVPHDPNVDAARRIASVGRTDVVLRREGSSGNVSMTMLHNVDSTQILLVPPSSTAWIPGHHTLVFTYHRDLGDETGNMDHRYDRAREFRDGAAAVEIGEVAVAL